MRFAVDACNTANYSQLQHITVIIHDIFIINSLWLIAHIHLLAFLCSNEPTMTALLKSYALVNAVK